MAELTISKSLNKAYRQVPVDRAAFDTFKTQLHNFFEQITVINTEEKVKGDLMDFLKLTFYGQNYKVSPNGKIDCAIHLGNNIQDPVGVIFEVKMPGNVSEMITREDLNRKALQELLLYYLRERHINKNIQLKQLIVTNIHEYFIFDAQEFERLFYSNKKLIKSFDEFNDGTLASDKTDFFYKEIAADFIAKVIDQINYINEQERVRLLREDFSYAMVHDMKSPLTSIIMGTKYLHSGVLEKKPEIKEKYFTIVEDEAQHLLALINRLLTISKLEHGKLNIQKTIVKLEPMIEDVTEKYKAKSAKPIHIATQLKVTTVVADEEYLKEAISNLIDNATKYSKEKINIRISTLEDNHYIYIKVYDEGIGISKSEQKSVFNRFERAAEHEKNGNKTRKGFGIGLNYVFQVIHAHGGKISLKSEKDKWTEFTIALPKVSDKQ